MGLCWAEHLLLVRSCAGAQRGKLGDGGGLSPACSSAVWSITRVLPRCSGAKCWGHHVLLSLSSSCSCMVETTPKIFSSPGCSALTSCYLTRIWGPHFLSQLKSL